MIKIISETAKIIKKYPKYQTIIQLYAAKPLMTTRSKKQIISILVPCKNASLFIDECISSITKQTYTLWELIIVDDHSSDQSWIKLQNWADKHPNIQILQNKGTGIINALRLAYKHSNGNIITRMDADDIMPPEKLSTMMNQLQREGPGNIATGKVKYFRNDQALGDGYIRYAQWLNSLSETGCNYREIYKECVIPSPCWMIYREDLDLIGAFQSNTYPEDYDLVFRMYKQKLNVIPSTNKTLHLWRDHSNRASRNDDNYKDNRFIELKVKYFLEIDYNPSKPLVLWGAGTKAKRIAKHLIAAQINFKWITDNEKKIGHNIYGIIVSSTSSLSSIENAQMILTVANAEQQADINNHIKSINTSGGYQSFWFC